MTRQTFAPRERPFTAWLLVILILFLGIAAIISGAMLFISPEGNLMQMPTEVLKDSPFPDYLVPGIILFIFVGVYPFAVGIGHLKRTMSSSLDKINPFKNYQWAWSASLTVGIILLIWIITETLMLGYVSFLQPLMAAWGIVILLLTLLPATRRYFRKTG